MTVKGRTKTLARRLQAATDKPYATCHQQVDKWEKPFSEGFHGDWDEPAYQVATAELLAATEQAAATLPRGSLHVGIADFGHGTIAAVASLTPSHRDEHPPTRLQIDAYEGYLGYQWWINDNLHVMATFGGVGGEALTTETLLHTHPVELPRITDGIAWLMAQFAAHPDRYDDTDRPAVIQAPIFE